jgi:hypothetical protein
MRQVAVIDDITLLQYFGRHILAAPEVRLESEGSRFADTARNNS